MVIILNDNNEVLLQKRHDGTWGLPGGLMDVGDSFEAVAKREVFEETGLTVHNLTLLNVFSGADYYLKVANGDELYAVTAVFYTKDVTGKLQIDYSESEMLQYVDFHNLPQGLSPIYKSYIVPYVDILLLL